jgi:hypothetical protein
MYHIELVPCVVENGTRRSTGYDLIRHPYGAATYLYELSVRSEFYTSDLAQE